MAGMTLPYLLKQAQEHPREVAIREKQKGLAGMDLGAIPGRSACPGPGAGDDRVGKGDKLAILSDNRPVYWTMVAVQVAGGMPVPLYQDAISRELQYVIDHADATMVLAEDQEQVDKVLEIKDHLPKVRRIIYDDPKGMRHYTDRALIRFTEVQAQGQQLDRTRPGLFHELVAAGKPDDVALMSYTSGTTGTPKGAMLSHANLIAAVEGMQVESYRRTDETLAYLPRPGSVTPSGPWQQR